MSNANQPVFLALFIVLLLLSCPLLGFTAWFFLDGAVTYPARHERYLIYERLQRDHPADFTQRWVQTAQANGWPTTPPRPTSDLDILTQYIFGVICSAMSLVCLAAAAVFGVLMRRSQKAGAHPAAPAAS